MDAEVSRRGVLAGAAAAMAGATVAVTPAAAAAPAAQTVITMSSAGPPGEGQGAFVASVAMVAAEDLFFW